MLTISAVLGSQTRAFHPCRWPFGRLRTHSSLQPLQKTAPSHPQIVQCKHRHQDGRVLGQPAVLHFCVAKLPLNDAECVFHLGPDACLGLLQLVQDGSHGRALVQRTALGWAHGHMPVGLNALDFFALCHALVTCIGKYIKLFTMDQLAGLRHIIDVGRRAHLVVNQPRVGVCANLAFHRKVPLISLLGLVHLRVTFPILVLGRTGSGIQGSVHHPAFARHQAFVGQSGVDGGQDLFGQIMFFQEVSKPQDADPVMDALHTAQIHKLPVQSRLEQCLFHRQVGQAEPLLDEVDAQHGFQLERGPAGLGSRCVRRNQRQQLRPRHHQIHLVKKHRLASASLAQIQAKVLLLHERIVRRGAALWNASASEF